MREGIRGTNGLNVGDPGPGIPLGKRPRDDGTKGSNQEEPK